MTKYIQSTEEAYISGDSIGRGHFHRLTQAWQTKTGRRALIISIGLVVVVVTVAIAAVMFLSLSGESHSYKDGFAEGGNVYSADSVAQQGPEQACKTAAKSKPAYGGPPTSDNSTQWIKGCVDAFNEAQSDN